MSVRRLRERAVKEALLAQIRSSGRITVDDIVEWLWEDFGIRVKKRSWESIARAILRSDDVGPQDLAVFMMEKGLTPDEGAWDARTATRLRGGEGARESGEGG